MEYPKLCDEDLKKNKYDIDTLIWNIKHSAISLKILVRTQKLTPYVCAKYVVFGGRNGQYGYGRYAFGSEDSWISTGDVLYFQKHITEEEMIEAHRIADAEDEIEEMEEKMKKDKENL